MKDKLKRLELFFSYDMLIKNLLFEATWKDEYGYDIESLFKYEDRLGDILEKIKTALINMTNLYYPFFSKDVNTFFNEINLALINATGKKDIIKSLVNNNIELMREDFVDFVDQTCIGYRNNLEHDVMNPISINEYLHFLHTLALNDEHVYHSIPEIYEDLDNDTVKLRGKDNTLALSIVENLRSANLDARTIDVVSLDKKILIMAQGLAHALMMEIEIIDDMAMVKYFIPKINDYEEINKLKGITKVSAKNTYTTGLFAVSTDELEEEITKFMMMVPTDVNNQAISITR